MTLRAAFESQARATEALGSPFMGRLMRLCAARLEPDAPLTRRMFDWPGDVSAAGASVPLRLAGALHGLVLDGTAPGLAAAYPPHEADDDALWWAVAAALRAHAARISAWMDSPPQTNEVRRAAVLIAAAQWLQARFGMPLRLSELGASAGLNLMFDRFALEIAGRAYGAASPALTLAPDWAGPLPPRAGPLEVVARRGVDLAPLDPQDPGDQLRLTAYLWPDQPERLARTRAAISVAQAEVDAGDAADWLEARLAEAPPRGTCHMLYHTVAWQYFPQAVKARCTQLIEAAGARATPQEPLAWFGMEADDVKRGAGLRLRLWPGDISLTMGRADFHTRWVDWAPPRASSKS